MPSPNGGRASQMAPLCSLPIEVQMYLVLPVIFLLTARATDLSRLGALYLLSLVFAWYAPQLSYRLSGAMFGPCFFAGILALAMRSRVKPRFPAGFWSIFLISVVCTYIVIEDSSGDVKLLCLVLT